MRITERQIEKIKEFKAKYFKEKSTIYLFGSRVDDKKKGGDYDFFIEVEDLSDEEIFEKRLQVLGALFYSDEFQEEKVDIVVCNKNNNAQLPIYKIAKETGVCL